MTAEVALVARKDDFYITALKYARQEMRETGQVDFNTALEYVGGKHSEINEDAIRDMCNHALRGLAGGGWTLSPGAYFQLLEHEELQEARQASSRALIVAISAFLVSSAAVITSAL